MPSSLNGCRRVDGSGVEYGGFPLFGEFEKHKQNTSWEAAREFAEEAMRWGGEAGYNTEDLDKPPSPLSGEAEGGRTYILIRAPRQRLMEEAERIGLMVDVADSQYEQNEDDKQDEKHRSKRSLFPPRPSCNRGIDPNPSPDPRPRLGGRKGCRVG